MEVEETKHKNAIADDSDLFADIAIPISWPDKTALGDEYWMWFLKQIGLVKNLNFKVGHAAIVLVNRQSGELRYFDFGRYITPRGYGRARSARFDPRLKLYTTAKFDSTTQLVSNINEITDELARLEHATHGGGRMLYTQAPAVSFEKGVAFAETLVAKGPIRYGAFARANNSCSRYVVQVLTAAMQKSDFRVKKLLFPECLKASPTSNVVNASPDYTISCYENGRTEQFKLDRTASLQFQWDLLKDNLYSNRAEKLSKDDGIGLIDEPVRSKSVPLLAQWLGGIGEGIWLHIIRCQTGYQVTRYNMQGEIEYVMELHGDPAFNPEADHQFTYDFSHTRYKILQNGRVFEFSSPKAVK